MSSQSSQTSQSSHPPQQHRYAQFAQAWLILAFAVTATLSILATPYSIGLYGLAGLWMPGLLLLPLTLQAAALRTLHRFTRTLPL